jgi:hypothetical protein
MMPGTTEPMFKDRIWAYYAREVGELHVEIICANPRSAI